MSPTRQRSGAITYVIAANDVDTTGTILVMFPLRMESDINAQLDKYKKAIEERTLLQLSVNLLPDGLLARAESKEQAARITVMSLLKVGNRVVG